MGAVCMSSTLTVGSGDASMVGFASLVTINAVMTAASRTLAAGPTADTCCAPSAGLDVALGADRLAQMAKALGDPLRVQIVDVLARSERDVCQCELIALFGVRQSLLSHHLRKLVDAELVAVQRRHKWAYYSIRTEAFKELDAWLSRPLS
jgi:ArsR family transcriptional regulator